MTQIIAEVGMAHDGSLNAAHAYVDAVADAGADGVKFQIHHPAEGTATEPWRRAWSRYHESRAAYWRRTAFTPEQWQGLAAHARERRLRFGASVFCVEAADVLAECAPDFYKVSAGMVVHHPLLRHIEELRASDATPVYVSAGMAEARELDRAMELLGADTAALLHCVSVYPTPHDKAAWGRRETLQYLAQSNGWSLGLSDHSGTIWPGVLACSEGDAVVEAHVCFDRAQGGPDAPSSLTFAELRQLVEARDAIATLKASDGWERPDTAALYEPTWVQEDGVWAVKKNGGIGRPADRPAPTEGA